MTSWSFLLVSLRLNSYTEWPEPAAFESGTVFERSTPQLISIALIPSHSQLLPVDAKEGVIVGFFVLNAIPELHNGYRNRWRCDCDSQQSLILFQSFFGKLVSLFFDGPYFGGWWAYRR